MTKLRDLPDFSVLWSRRTTITESNGEEIHLLSVPDLARINHQIGLQAERDTKLSSLDRLLHVFRASLPSCQLPGLIFSIRQGIVRCF
jgi:hypothetical protein